MSERVTITIEPSAAHGGVLTVEDVMRQVLDFIEMITAATPDRYASALRWSLVSARMESPFTAVAEAVSADPEWPSVDSAAREAKALVSSTFHRAERTGELPDWLKTRGRDRLERIYERTLNGIGRTTIDIGEEAPLVIVERNARATLKRMKDLEDVKPDLSGDEYGSIDAYIIEATTHYNKPAIRVRDRLSGDKITCILPEKSAAQRVGTAHNWAEIWEGKRVLISGCIRRSKDGTIASVVGTDVVVIDEKPVDLQRLYDPNFTSGKDEVEYLDELWSSTDG